MFITVEIGRNVVLLRNLREISQEQLALRSDLSVSYLRDIEHGRANPSLDTLDRLAKTLEIDIRVLFLYSLEDEEILNIIHRTKDSLGYAIAAV